MTASPEQSIHDGPITWAVRSPVTVAVLVLLVAMFGLQALFLVPIQLTPDVTRPVVSVETLWPGANPQEVEREVVERQEKALKSLEGLLKMEAECAPNLGRVTLEFAQGTDLDTALLRVGNALNEVPAYPAEVDKPILTTAGDREGAIGWFILLPADPKSGVDIDTQREFVEDELQARLERVPGVAAMNFFGGRERQIEVTLDPVAVAQHGLTMRQIAARLSAEDRDVSAGHLDEAKRRYTLRAVGAFDDPAEIGGIVLRDDVRDRVFLRDVGTAAVSYKEPEIVVRYKGVKSIAFNIQKRTGSNVLAVMDGVEKTLSELNAGILSQRGLKVVGAYDASDYIRGALDLVQNNIVVGSLLAVLVLFVFLRSPAPTAIIGVSIPVSAVGTFLAMFLLGRNINVVSLAGLSFAVGMLVDNSIVVLESIFSRVEKGETIFAAAVGGTRDVWGAVFASTATTVAVFLPIFFLHAEVAQLFRDIAIAIACAVSLSLVVSVFAIPTMAVGWMREGFHTKEAPALASRILRWLTGSVWWICGTVPRRLAVVTAMTGLSLGGSWMMMPPAEYLPEGNQNLLFGLLIPPSGYNLQEFNRIGDAIEAELAPLWSGEKPQISNFFYVAFGRQVIMGIGATDQKKIAELRAPVQAALAKIPGMIAIVIQPSIFEQGLAGGRSIDLKLQGPDLSRLVKLAQRSFFGVLQHLPGAQPQPIPGLELGQPELQVRPDRQRLAEVGLDASELGFIVDVMADGARVSEIRTGDGRKVDLVLRGRRDALAHTQDLAQLPVFVPSGGTMPLEALSTIDLTMGPDVIHHHERERAYTVRVTLPPGIAMEEAMEIVRTKIVAPLRAEGLLDAPYKWRLAGTADKLTATKEALGGQFLTALVITYLLMASCFESFLYPLIIMFSVPLASLGGFAALKLVNVAVTHQSLDVLAMLGFIILVGVVVNNAILLVDRALRSIREEGLAPRDAVTESVGARIRPIFMTTLTSVAGMAPLILMTGPGSELYRGIGSVVVGGLLVSTVFTLFLIPALLSLVLELRLKLLPGKRI
ncbi:MAG: efflux RND transporter permease subunit [Candidatus Wallbacteria bacterium]|nr:efflux RND transporter permease subunit [Candidatus Wallbacteria bacterium]